MTNPERAKYEQMWGFNQYRRYAPGEVMVGEFLRHVAPLPGSSVIDFGAGTGRGAHNLSQRGFDVHMLDFAENCLDIEVLAAVNRGELTFTHHDLLNPSPKQAEYGYCTDVMEHIQPEDVDTVLDNILDAAEKVFFQISLEDDACGALIGEHLHLTVKPMEWWTAKMDEHKAFIYYSDKQGENAVFFVSKKADAGYIELNADIKQIEAHIRHNSTQGYTDVVPHATSPGRLMLLAGGPSLNDFKEDIQRRAAEGVPVICTNGTYNWALDNDITPNGLIVVDARANNADFVRQAIPNCKFLFASQCHPDLFEKVPARQVWLWHSHIEGQMDEMLGSIYGEKPWHSVPGGTTVTLRAIPLLSMLGWKKLDIYGFDSCLRASEHHAYEQSENEGQVVSDVTIGGKAFKCHRWMVVQGEQFDKLYTAMRSNIDLRIFGGGLTATLKELIDKTR